MIERYSISEMSDIFTDKARLSRWLDVEIALVNALGKSGVIPNESAIFVDQNRPTIDDDFIEKVANRESITDHDLAAFVDIVQDSFGREYGKWIHYGLTSSDVVDTSLGITLKKASLILLERLDDLIEVLKSRANEFTNTPMAGRTHGMHAEPTTFGAKLALWCLQAKRDRERLYKAHVQISVGKLSGAVGTYSNIDPSIEEDVCRSLGLTPVKATQVISRDRHAEYLYACCAVGTTIELIATEIRHLARTELGEATEAFKSGQKGSSAMPHKRNPILSERLCGLSRVLRGYLLSGLEDVALWHERDISHSSVERVIIPDASILTHYMLVKSKTLIENLEVHPEKMLKNLDLSNGAIFSQSLLLSLVGAGFERDSAYRIVQSATRKAFEDNISLEEIISMDNQVISHLNGDQIREIFSLDRILKHAHLVVESLEE